MTDISANALLDSLFDGVYCVDEERRIIYWNKAAERITGYTASEVIGSRCSDNILRHIDNCGNELCIGMCPLFATLQDGKSREAAVYAHHKAGHRVPVQVRTAPILDENGVMTSVVEIFTDNANQVQMVQELEKLRRDAFNDPLTGVGNRRYGEIALDSMTYEWRMHSVAFGLLFVDVDHFKKVNDRWGHDVGDEVLKMVAQTIRNVVRGLDIVARWGGEEFIVIVPQATPEILSSLGERIRATVQHCFIMKGAEKVEVTVSIGGAVASDDDSPASIVGKADAQMYYSKRHGRSRVTIHQ
ncbi:sensor domain-containing diguanylate cyclase [Geomesophilobacter sediminis]|uniref:Sensor domain-containing diguanylate cyclase n=1 Tax=Geomesophilobacter sediminis TaxID=2798584 RepID=A0A8J7M299_9BACT|nr:sensor domain-containing diguanylate cyclase [Geomesophilobacter sediminis]MBJ6727395.1 sensor domain-containing diguanylate cyclase [Geomesophilobacter sediminis]